MMNRDEILLAVNAVFSEILEQDRLVLTETTTAADVADWDSLTHVQLVVAVERRFGIRFASKEIRNWKNVGEMIDSIVARSK